MNVLTSVTKTGDPKNVGRAVLLNRSGGLNTSILLVSNI